MLDSSMGDKKSAEESINILDKNVQTCEIL